ncbi:MAG: permease [Pirellula sp.]
MDMQVLVWGALTRMLQALVAASPTIVIGWLVAAIFERILGREGTYKLFGGNTWRQLPQAWLLGMLLPVCSLGVIPVMHQMRKSGISGGTILAFGLTAPLFNPISVLYGLTLSDPWAVLAFSLSSLILITVLGLLWDWLFPNSQMAKEPLDKTPYGLRRIGAVALSMVQQAASWSTLYMLLAILGVGILAALLPAGVLQRAAGKDDMIAPLTMTAVATLAYITPMTAIVQVASMFQHGNSVAAAFALLTLGTGVNLGLVVWIIRHYSFRRSLVWFTCLVAIVLLMSYSLDKPLRPKGIEPADHTHAFDTYCNPFVSGDQNYWMSAKRVLEEAATPAEIIALGVAGLMLVSGALAYWLDPKNQWMQWLIRVPNADGPGLQSKAMGMRDIVLPDWVIATVSLGGLLAASILACFLYYPPVSEIRKEMHMIEAEMFTAYRSGQWETLEYWIPIQEDWAQKMKVSAYLRGKPLDRYTDLKLQVYRTKLELLEHATEDRDREEALKFGTQGAKAFGRLKKALDN